MRKTLPTVPLGAFTRILAWLLQCGTTFACATPSLSPASICLAYFSRSNWKNKNLDHSELNNYLLLKISNNSILGFSSVTRAFDPVLCSCFNYNLGQNTCEQMRNVSTNNNTTSEWKPLLMTFRFGLKISCLVVEWSTSRWRVTQYPVPFGNFSFSHVLTV